MKHCFKPTLQLYFLSSFNLSFFLSYCMRSLAHDRARACWKKGGAGITEDAYCEQGAALREGKFASLLFFFFFFLWCYFVALACIFIDAMPADVFVSMYISYLYIYETFTQGGKPLHFLFYACFIVHALSLIIPCHPSLM